MFRYMAYGSLMVRISKRCIQHSLTTANQFVLCRHHFSVMVTQRRFVYCDACSNGVSMVTQRHCFEELVRGGVESPDVCVHQIKKLVQANFSVDEQEEKFRELCKQRLLRIPLQYVIEEWDFRHLHGLKMRKPVFIPRPETEGLIDLINVDLNTRRSGQEHVNVLEVGCGTGAISLSILKENERVNCVALDILEDAVDLCQLNARRQQLSHRLKVYHQHIESFDLEQHEVITPFDMLVSNPPYIPSDQLSGLQEEVIGFESRLALDGGEDGLDVVRCILNRSPHLLKPQSSVWLEVDEKHPAPIRKLINSSFPNFQFVKSYKDCFNRSRFCHLRYMDG